MNHASTFTYKYSPPILPSNNALQQNVGSKQNLNQQQQQTTTNSQQQTTTTGGAGGQTTNNSSEPIPTIDALYSPRFPLEVVREFVMEAIQQAVAVNQVHNRDPIGGSNENLFL